MPVAAGYGALEASIAIFLEIELYPLMCSCFRVVIRAIYRVLPTPFLTPSRSSLPACGVAVKVRKVQGEMYVIESVGQVKWCRSR